jgi:O-antigen ligase
VIADLKSGWKNIFFGHGLNSRVILFPSSRYTSWESEYIESFMTQGLIGLLLVIMIYYQFFKNLFNLQRKSSNSIYRIFSLGISVSGISFWIISFFSSELLGQNSSAYFVVLYSLIILIGRKIKDESSQLPSKI